MKPSEIRSMSMDDRIRKLSELRGELVKLKLQARVGKLTDTARIRNLKRDIARILTIIREEEIARMKSRGTSGKAGEEG
ncbi:MAG: 50S ribosomal protein L29 [Desulfurococcaceae archaeon]